MGYVPNLRLVVPEAREMTAREEKAATVRALREEGHTYKAIGRILGIGVSMAHQLHDDPTGEKARGRKRRYERPCVDCGKTLNPNGSAPNTVRCFPCLKAHQYAEGHRWIVESVAEWVRLFGAPPAATDWNLGLIRGKPNSAWKIRRIERTGRSWPSVTHVQRHFGSWNNMLRELGHRPLEPSEYAMGRHGVALRDEDRV
jgi:hypothetical protein